MLSRALGNSFEEADLQRSSRLLEEAEKIRRDLTRAADRAPASQAIFDSLVDGQLR
jgi:hypothetical protein